MAVTELGMFVSLHPRINVFDAVSIIALQLSRESKTLFPLSTLMLVSPVQPLKAYSLIDMTEVPMVTLVNPVQLENTYLAIEVSELGMVTFVRLLQSENAFSPIEVTEFGMATLVRLLQ